jgi:transposase
MTIYCGVDFHARQQTICFYDTTECEVRLKELRHGVDDVGGFYSGLGGEVIVGLEASGYSSWFVELLEGLGHQVWLGNASEIRRRARRRQKNDRRDAELILTRSSSAEASKHGLPGLQHRHRLPGVCDWAASLCCLRGECE